MPINLVQGLNALCSGKKIALLSYNDEAFMEQAVSNQTKCRIIQIPDPLFKTVSAMYLSLNSPFLTVFNQKYEHYGIIFYIVKGIYIKVFFSWLRFKVAGIQQKMAKEIFGTAAENIDNELEQIKLTEIVPVMSLLAAGLILSFLILFLEIFFKKITKLEIIKKKSRVIN